MSQPNNQEESKRDNRAFDQLHTVRKIGFMSAIALIGLKIMSTGGLTFRLGETGRDLLVPASITAIAGIISVLAAAFISAEHFSRTMLHLPDAHFLRQRMVLYCSWAVVALVVVFTFAGVAGAA